MKAILVVDIPDDYDEYGSGVWCVVGDDLRIVYEEDGALMEYKYIDYDIAELKPMPIISKKRINDLKKWGWSEQEILMYENGFDYCIDEIVGAEE